MTCSRVVLSGAILAALALSCPAAVTAETRDKVYALAESDRLAARYEAAAAGFLEVAQFEPRNGHTWIRRGVCLHELKRYQESMLDECRAHPALVLAREDKRNRAVALTNRADSALSAGEFAGAFADGMAATKVDETYGRAYQLIADVWYAVGNYGQAQGYFAEAKKRDSTLVRNFDSDTAARNSRSRTQPADKYDSTPDFNAAVAAANDGKYDEAIAIYDRLLARQPLNHAAWSNRGNALRSLKRYAEAVICHSRAAAVSGAYGAELPLTANHFINRLNCWLDLGEVDAALIDGELVTRAVPDVTLGWRRLAAAAYRCGELEQARAAFAEAKKRDDNLREPSFTEDGARAHRAARLARRGDRAALGELVHVAVHGKHDSFELNPDRAAAIEILDAELKRSPRDIDLLLLRAQAEDAPKIGIKLGTAAEALPFADRALEIDPNHGRARIVRGLLLANVFDDKAKVAAGVVDLDRGIELGAGTAEAFATRAKHRMEQENFSGAIADLTQAIESSPSDDHYDLRASAREHAKQWSAAIEDYAVLIERHATEARWYRRRAEARLLAKQWPEALADFDEAIERDARNGDHHLGRAAALRGMNSTADARAAHQRAKELDATLPALAADFSNAAEIEALRNDFQHAMQKVSAAMNRVNQSSVELLRAQAQKTRAEQRLRRLLAGEARSHDEIIEEVTGRDEAGWADAEDLRDRAQAHAGKKNFDGALADVTRALELEATHAKSFNFRGRLHEAREEYDEAFADYDKAVALAPDDADFHRDRGDIWWQRKDFEAAFRDYDAAVEHDAANADNWFKRGNTRYMLTRFAEAVADYDKALELKPDFAAATKNREQAREHLPSK